MHFTHPQKQVSFNKMHFNLQLKIGIGTIKIPVNLVFSDIRVFVGKIYHQNNLTATSLTF